MEVPAPSAGIVEKLLIKLGDKVSEGYPIVLLKDGDASVPAPPSLIEQQEPPPFAQPCAFGSDGACGEAEWSRRPVGFQAGARQSERAAPGT
jgi:pyruvate/2-oxoglutarate dehydrogenase complex dihydrolipoamide acyltransferase (E2) component